MTRLSALSLGLYVAALLTALLPANAAANRQGDRVQNILVPTSIDAEEKGCITLTSNTETVSFCAPEEIWPEQTISVSENKESQNISYTGDRGYELKANLYASRTSGHEGEPEVIKNLMTEDGFLKKMLLWMTGLPDQETQGFIVDNVLVLVSEGGDRLAPDFTLAYSVILEDREFFLEASKTEETTNALTARDLHALFLTNIKINGYPLTDWIEAASVTTE